MRMLGTHTLLYPIELETRTGEGEIKVEELKPAGFCVVMRRPRAKDLKIVDDFGGRQVAMTLALIGRLSNLDADEVDNLDAEDLDALGNLLPEAAPAGPKTGETA